MSLIAIDPGFTKRGRGCAVAMFEDRHVHRVLFARPETVDRDDLNHAVDIVAWEIPQIDARTRVSTPSVVQLAAVGGTLAGMYAAANDARIVAVTPREWKGSIAKPIAHYRLWNHLEDYERALLGGTDTEREIDRARRRGALDRWAKPGAAYYPASFETHNLLDAVGIGRYVLGLEIEA